LEAGTALAFGSGMAAISAVIEMLPIGGPVVVGEAYNGTRRLLADSQSRGRLTVHAAEVADTAATLSVCASAVGAGGSASGQFAEGGLLWLESPTNPLLAVADLPALIAGAHDLGMSVAVDNTFATPLLQQPLNLGADVVVHSVTKMLGGHSDLLMGAAVARSPGLVAGLINRRSLHGAIPGPLSAFLALRGMRTLSVRLERAQSNAGSIASRLVSRPGVTVVRYPGLADDPGHAVALRQMRGFGAMVSFDVEGGAEVAEAVCSAVRVITPGTSLGGVETLIERRGRYLGESHLPPGLLRLAVGIEAIEDLWADLDQAIATATGLA
jgi:cystathionine gamma-synthase